MLSVNVNLRAKPQSALSPDLIRGPLAVAAGWGVGEWAPGRARGCGAELC
jgi:hypothetical protein